MRRQTMTNGKKPITSYINKPLFYLQVISKLYVKCLKIDKFNGSLIFFFIKMIHINQNMM